MLEQRWPNDSESANRFWRALACAFFLETAILAVVGYRGHWLAHPKTGLDESRFIEAEVFEIPRQAHLVEEKPVVRRVRHNEPVLSKVPNQGRAKKAGEKSIQEENQTESGVKTAPTHGPVAIYAPQPVLPDYLRQKELNTTVVIDFFVSAQGVTTPRLAGSSGNEELDAIAISTAKKWQFRPAEKDHKPVASKVRLRIIFEVQ